ncbi:DUF3310 domain-containing protein [Gordonibacter massiliensis (ex Traore et al. 2017)]|uniref:DUF3310 domain-containing protein n=1 Tax=Gordonibacter massiliensis (ex Traore et al. 2017) TaxID=1841863 RepID=UPI001C8B67F7|nr:DUF3310 domain-containing protein [Gordonibacter massiliensis (ex Traore et al. 2017)]MBX9035062.1 DUF3310 domain-containing protein [Gordonibacter massiliensis (ex Traore et al. 2017)]
MPDGNEIEHPSHYTSGGVECIDGIRAALGEEGFEAYCAGNVVKYVWRYRHKGGLADVLKARRYLDWLADSMDDGADEKGGAPASKLVYGSGGHDGQDAIAGPWVAM